MQGRKTSTTVPVHMLRFMPLLLATLVIAAPAKAGEVAPDAEELKRLLAWFLDGASPNDNDAQERLWAEELV